MTQWLWGKLHTVKLKHNVSNQFDIPSVSVMPDGFPRGGDNFTVDACNPGFYDSVFTYSGGAAIRNVYSMTNNISCHRVIQRPEREPDAAALQRRGVPVGEERGPADRVHGGRGAGREGADRRLHRRALSPSRGRARLSVRDVLMDPLGLSVGRGLRGL